MAGGVTVRVPGSTSNLGSGFDFVGMAIDRGLRLTARLVDDGRSPPVAIERRGTLAGLDVAPHEDLMYRGFTAACAAAGRPVPGRLAFSADSDVPVSRGLGSSAAAVVAGAAAAVALLGLGLGPDALFQIGAEVEGHPDNVAPAVFGGARLVLHRPAGGLLAPPLDVHPGLAFAFAVPAFTVETKRARAVLPESVPHATAVQAAARGAALIRGLAMGEAELLAVGLDDLLHVPHRRALVRGYDAVTAAARAAGAYGATLSGSGPTIVAVASRERAAAVAHAMTAAWRDEGLAAECFTVARGAGGLSVMPEPSI
jgi:homoserine kinase